jgi:2-keto-4-pentenoate hydratase/2-oxohepta-3-ene-1,7-dioic acid hydratase in catechol pathway
VIQLVSFDTGAGARPGLLRDGQVFAFGAYASTADVLDDWAAASQWLQEGARRPADATPVRRAMRLAPITAPRNIYFAGANYRDHVEEMKRELRMPLDIDPRASGVRPWHSLKATGSTIVGPGAVVQRPGGTLMLDWELELAAVIGVRAKDLDEVDALSCVAGYTVANDLSARDHVGRPTVADTSPFKWDWVAQKSFDGSCPLGPAMTPATVIGDVQDLDMKLWVNDELKQDSNTGQMIFGVAEQIAYLSTRITLQPGDVILTGTPAGVGMTHRSFLRPGDVVRQWIENIGEFEFSIA